jgi:hypothetical protein
MLIKCCVLKGSSDFLARQLHLLCCRIELHPPVKQNGQSSRQRQVLVLLWCYIHDDNAQVDITDLERTHLPKSQVRRGNKSLQKTGASAKQTGQGRDKAVKRVWEQVRDASSSRWWSPSLSQSTVTNTTHNWVVGYDVTFGYVTTEGSVISTSK